MWKYYHDPYLKELETTVKEVNDNKVILEDTIFYPTGGGQPHDRGTISNQEVLDVFEQGSDVVHVLDQAPFSPGDRETCLLDWDYRYTVMRMHSALHLLFDVAGELYSISASAGSNVEAEKSRLDLVYDDVLDEAKRAALEKHFAAVVDEDRPITAWWEGEKRLVQIEGYDPMPCGGLHTKSTKEIGHLSKLKRKNVGKGKERVEVFL
ncbi:MAG: alanyl-tRNA editing protein [Candidatus Methanofastidiosia archaeon]